MLRLVVPVHKVRLGQTLQSLCENLTLISDLPADFPSAQLELVQPCGQITLSASHANRKMGEVMTGLCLIPMGNDAWGKPDPPHSRIATLPDELPSHIPNRRDADQGAVPSLKGSYESQKGRLHQGFGQGSFRHG